MAMASGSAGLVRDVDTLASIELLSPLPATKRLDIVPFVGIYLATLAAVRLPNSVSFHHSRAAHLTLSRCLILPPLSLSLRSRCWTSTVLFACGCFPPLPLCTCSSFSARTGRTMFAPFFDFDADRCAPQSFSRSCHVSAPHCSCSIFGIFNRINFFAITASPSAGRARTLHARAVHARAQLRPGRDSRARL